MKWVIGLIVIMSTSHAHERLEIVQMGNPVLRQQARELSIEEILSDEIQELIQKMKATVSGVGVGLAAPQIGISLQLAVIEDPEAFHKTIPAQFLAERERVPVPFHVIINPKLTLLEGETVAFFEGCLSVSNCMGMTSRARFVRVDCLNEKGEPVVIQAKGWYARILQHEIDHLNGTLYIDRVYTKSLCTTDNFEKYWRHRPIEESRALLK